MRDYRQHSVGAFLGRSAGRVDRDCTSPTRPCARITDRQRTATLLIRPTGLPQPNAVSRLRTPGAGWPSHLSPLPTTRARTRQTRAGRSRSRGRSCTRRCRWTTRCRACERRAPGFGLLAHQRSAKVIRAGRAARTPYGRLPPSTQARVQRRSRRTFCLDAVSDMAVKASRCNPYARG